MPRVVRGLYATPRDRFHRPEGGLNLRLLVEEARHMSVFDRLFGQTADVVELVAAKVQRIGWTLSRAEIAEALEETA